MGGQKRFLRSWRRFMTLPRCHVGFCFAIVFTPLLFRVIPASTFIPVQKVREVHRDSYGDPLPVAAACRLGTVRLRHVGKVRATFFTPDHKLLVTLAEDQVYVWERETGKKKIILRKLDELNRPIAQDSIALSPDGSQLCAAGLGELLFWDMKGYTLAQHVVLSPHLMTISSVLAYSPRGHTLAIAGLGGRPLAGVLVLWDTKKRSVERRLHLSNSNINAVAFDPKGTIIACACEDGPVLFVSIPTGNVVHRFLNKVEAPDNRMRAITYAPKGNLMALAGDDGLIHVLNTATWQEMSAFRGHDGPVNSLAFSPDGQMLVSGGEDRTTRLWDVRTGKMIRVIRGHAARVIAVAISPDGKVIASSSADNTTRLLSIPSGTDACPVVGHQGEITSFAFVGSAYIASASRSPTIFLWNLSDGKLVRKMEGHTGDVLAVLSLRDGKRLISGGWDRTVRLWDANTGKQLKILHTERTAVLSLALTSDNKVLTIGTQTGDIRLLDVDTGKMRLLPQKHRIGVESLDFTVDGKRLVSRSKDGTIILWNITTGQVERVISERSGGLGGIVRFSSDGKFVASAVKHRVFLWDVSTGAVAGNIDGFAIKPALAFSNKRRLLASGDADGKIKLWQLPGGTGVGHLDAHDGAVTYLDFSPDGRWLVAGYTDTSLLVWDLAKILPAKK
jgi:WD40 repeat protein